MRNIVTTNLHALSPALIDIRFEIEQLLSLISRRQTTEQQNAGASENFVDLGSMRAVEARIESGLLVLRCVARTPLPLEKNNAVRTHGAAIDERYPIRRRHPPSQQPTARELNVLALVREGRRNREIAELLHVSQDTVKTRLKNAMAKLCAGNRTHAVTLARQRGLLDDVTAVETGR